MAISVTLLPYALTTFDMAKDHLGIPDAVITSDERIKRHINAATDMLERLTDRMLKSRTGLVDIQSGRRNDRILVPQWPVTSITELWEDCDSDFTDTTKIIPSSDYRIETTSRGEGIGIVLKSGKIFPNGKMNLKIVYDAGYATVPSDLEEACLFLMDFLYDIRQDRRVGTVQKGKNQENITYLESLPLWIQDTIGRYTRAEFANGNIAIQNG